jgi:periplasmic protein CpxP/Spy
MKSALFLAAALAAGLATQAFAAEQAASPATNAPAVSAQAAALTADANAQVARKILLAQGYSNVSELNRDAKGHWAGTAVKDGKTVGVAIALPNKEISVSKTN